MAIFFMAVERHIATRFYFMKSLNIFFNLTTNIFNRQNLMKLLVYFKDTNAVHKIPQILSVVDAAIFSFAVEAIYLHCFCCFAAIKKSFSASARSFKCCFYEGLCNLDLSCSTWLVLGLLTFIKSIRLRLWQFSLWLYNGI